MLETVPLVIIGSSRKDSDTRYFVDQTFVPSKVDIADLLDYKISGYSYDHDYSPEDEFEKLISLILSHDKIVFATPVYWYAMSGVMKTFFDRITDLVTYQKIVGRNLEGKSVLLVAVGSDPELPPGFEIPFRLTAEYLNMEYKGNIYFSSNSREILLEKRTEIEVFLDAIL